MKNLECQSIETMIYNSKYNSKLVRYLLRGAHCKTKIFTSCQQRKNASSKWAMHDGIEDKEKTVF